MPKPKIGGGAPASRSAPSIVVMVEAHRLVRPGHARRGRRNRCSRRRARRSRASRSRRRVGGGDQHRLDAMRPRRGGERRGLEQAARRRPARCRRPASAARRVEIVPAPRERRDWHRSGCRPARPDGAPGRRRARRSSPAGVAPAASARDRRRLDHRPVGDRIGEGDADLDHVGARPRPARRGSRRSPPGPDRRA